MAIPGQSINLSERFLSSPDMHKQFCRGLSIRYFVALGRFEPSGET